MSRGFLTEPQPPQRPGLSGGRKPPGEARTFPPGLNPPASQDFQLGQKPPRGAGILSTWKIGRVNEFDKRHQPVRFTDVSLGIHDAEVCLTCHSVLDEPDDWPDDGPEWSYPFVQVPWPCAAHEEVVRLRDRLAVRDSSTSYPRPVEHRDLDAPRGTTDRKWRAR